MPSIEELLAEYGFPAAKIVQGRSSVADLYKPGVRCGVYVLIFSDEQAYVGQSVDVVKRYAQHRHVHQDIKAISFKEVRLDDLDDTEQEMIARCERCGHKLRNVVFSAFPPTESDFDLIMMPDEQDRWLSDLDYVDAAGPRIVNDDLRRKHARKFHRFRMVRGSDEILQGVRCYFLAGVPAAKKGEVSFWSLSCLPSYKNREITVFMRLNIHWQEVLTVFREKKTGEDFFSLHLARKPVQADASLPERLLRLELSDHRYVPGGHDQMNIVVPSECFGSLIARRSIRTAIRQLNHRLMRKGACNFGRTHCLGLADNILGDQLDGDGE